MALFGDSGGEKTRAASSVLLSVTTAGRVSLLRYPVSTACACHVCANITAMLRVKMSDIARVALEYISRLVLVVTVTFGLMF